MFAPFSSWPIIGCGVRECEAIEKSPVSACIIARDAIICRCGMDSADCEIMLARRFEPVVMVRWNGVNPIKTKFKFHFGWYINFFPSWRYWSEICPPSTSCISKPYRSWHARNWQVCAIAILFEDSLLIRSSQTGLVQGSSVTVSVYPGCWNIYVKGHVEKYSYVDHILGSLLISIATKWRGNCPFWPLMMAIFRLTR